MHPAEHDLVDVALDGRADGSAAVHVRDCPSCAEQVASFREVLDLGRSAAPLRPAREDAEWVPSAGAWDAVAAELDLTDRSDPLPASVRAATPVPSPATAPADVPSPSPRGARVLVGALGLLLVGVVGGLGVAAGLDDDEGVVVALPALESATAPAGDLPSDARAEVVQGDAGTSVVVDATGLPPAGDADYEVWLLDPSDGRLQSLGVLRADGTADLPVPDGVALETYTAVDVSVEPRDGDPGHSGDSVLRGALPA